jgi:hypothetical protein
MSFLYRIDLMIRLSEWRADRRLDRSLPWLM